jgi:membrane associated rhomboid family serine protease
MIPIRDENPSRTFPLITLTLILSNSLIWLYEWYISWNGELFFERFIREFGLIPKNILTNPKTAITHMFLHGSWLHIISNMWVLWIFGDNVEYIMGRINFILFYILCGLGSAALQVTISFIFGGAETPMVGASGAISGVLAAYMKFFPRARILSLIPFLFYFYFAHIPAVIFIGFWFLSQIINGILFLPFSGLGGIAWWAHIGGFIFGLWLAPKFADITKPRRSKRTVRVIRID